MSSTRWDIGASVGTRHVFSRNKRERQRAVGAAPPESELRHKHFLFHYYWYE